MKTIIICNRNKVIKSRVLHAFLCPQRTTPMINTRYQWDAKAGEREIDADWDRNNTTYVAVTLHKINRLDSFENELIAMARDFDADLEAGDNSLRR